MKVRRRKPCKLPARHGVPWSEGRGEDTEQLAWYWGDLAIESIAARLDRTPTSVYSKAKRLGLKIGCPIGWIRVSDLAREIGFDRNTTLRILKRMGIELRRSWEPRTERKKRMARCWFPIVDHENAIDAVKRYLAMETVFDAAKRFGDLSHTYLKTLMVKAGHVPPPKGVRWRLPAGEFDKVYADWKARADSRIRPGNRKRPDIN